MRTTPLLIDGELIQARDTFVTVNPATEEPLGDAADGTAADMDRAIAAARTAFDESDWPNDTGLRVHCLRQLREALKNEIEVLRAITVAEVGAPVSLTYGGQLQAPVDDLAYVNGGVWNSADMPFGAYKQSGLGREMGLAGFEEFLQVKSIAEGVS